jgi:dephospho-CoA kinase
MKVAICGKMASGKTTIADLLSTQTEFNKYSLGGKVKEVAYDVFGMDPEFKDRHLLQQIGMQMRDIDADVWITAVMLQVARDEAPNAVVDDVRFVNEAEKFKKNGWILIKLDIPDDLQIERLKKTYPDNWSDHVLNRHDPSEAEVDQIPEEWFDFIVNVEDGIDNWTLIKDYLF